MNMIRKTLPTVVLLLVATVLWAQTTLREGMAALEQKYGVHFVYDAALPLEKKARQAEGVTLEQALESLFDGTDIRYEIKGNHVVLRKVRNVTISGLITDAATGETLIGAGATVGRDGAVTNNFGFYSLTIPEKEEVQVTYSYVGYATQTVTIPARSNRTVHVQLVPGASLEEAVVTAQKESGIASTKMSAIEVPLQVIKSAPALFGEADVIKTLQLLPGVQGGTEGFSGIYVRGGGPDENLLLLDGIPIYNAEHLLGIFSIFQPDAIKKMTLYKGSFPARYGGRISSIVDVRTNDGNLYETHGSFGVSMLADKFHLEGPLWKGRTSYSISARGMHTLLLTPILKAVKFDGNYFFYDLDAKVTHRFDDRNRLYFNVYNGMDDLYYRHKKTQDYTLGAPIKSFDQGKLGIRWGNTVAALRWNHVLSGKLFSNTTLAYNRYRMVMETEMLSEETVGGTLSDRNLYRFDYRSGMRDWVLKTDFEYNPAPSHRIHFGGSYTHHTFIPETLTNVNQQIMDTQVQVDTTWHLKSNSRQTGHEIGLYAEDDIRLGRAWTLNPGLHVSLFNTQGRSYFSVEPRLSAKVDLSQDWSAKASYSRMSQYVHLLTSSQVSLPLDLWVPITKDIAPETADQYSLGFYYSGLRGWEFSLEGYWKKMNNVLEYKDGVSFLFNSDGWENKVETGRGRAMGLELFIEKTMGKTTGWLGYTLSRSDRVFPTVNAGRWFPYRYDRRHNVNLVVNHRFNEKFDLSATWTYASGGTTTIPERSVVMMNPNGELFLEEYVPSRNNYRLPASHTLNLGFNFHRKHRRGEGIWNLSIYNAYNRMNPNFVVRDTDSYMSSFVDESGSDSQYIVKSKLVKLTFLPIFPSVGYTRSF
ncbi:MAG: TonB-dependent receptor [Bacteroidales bacterium]|nr:TonB-dependent receptor [Bacteroidales bacterium]